MTWNVETVEADVHTLHHLGPPDPAVRTARWCVPTRPAIVLGSAQKESDLDPVAVAELGLDLVRRRSGGGAVLVEPEDTDWVDLFIPADDPLWVVDVGKAFEWVGNLWVEVLADLLIADARAHTGALVTNEWSRKICFASLGPGEVTVHGRKVVGISQRRTREGALFQCSLYRRFRTDRLIQTLAVEPMEALAAATAVDAAVTALAYEPAALRAALVHHLPR